MMLRHAALLAIVIAGILPVCSQAEDIAGIQEHPLISRYPGQDIRWQHIENHLPYRVPVGPVTGYRTIGDWLDIAGRVTCR